MKAMHLICNPFLLVAMSLSIFLSTSPLWANPALCPGVHGSPSESLVRKLQATLSKVPRDDYGLSAERWKGFQSSIDSVFATNENVHQFLWKFAQTTHHLKGVTRANPSQAAMQALREGRPLPDETKPLDEIESAVLSFMIRLPKNSLPPPVLVRNYRALLLLTGDATAAELANVKSVFAQTPVDASDPIWASRFLQSLDVIQKRLGHRILQEI